MEPSAPSDLRYHLSGGASAFALLSSRPPSATVQSVGAQLASHASTTLAWTLTDGSRA
jgi:hypothetical protein